MDVREELKQIIEAARADAVAAGDLPEGSYAPVQRLEVPPQRNSATTLPMRPCSGRERPAARRG